ncbi:MAG: hypothetical protein CMG64_01125 [Candidatus Marinimicrobia bacterium]|nr:hypothetical protein [Candidatus Neomarinimicrobiota bacterium]|tara:strand:+ start:6106 stop:7038 length:933 start_codon:yes stop_codon:yes gene_type:complete
MKNQLLFLILCFIVSNCAQQINIINYDNTNPVKIEQATQGLELNTLLNNIQKEKSIAVRSIEEYIDPDIDAGVVYMIEDYLITNIINNGYKAVERDPNIFKDLISESGENYKQVLDNKNIKLDAKKETSSNENIINIFTADQADNSNTEECKENCFYETSINTSDYILSYRVLECGVVYNEKENQSDRIVIDNPFNNDETHNPIERSARTRLHCRLTNSQTSEIVAAGIIENEIIDIVSSEDVEDLERISYKYYHHTLPNQRLIVDGKWHEDGYSNDKDDAEILKPKKAQRKKVGWGIGGAILALLFLAD